MRGPLGHHREHRIGARSPGGAPQALPEPERRRVADNQHLLALADCQAVTDDRFHRSIEISHVLSVWSHPSASPERNMMEVAELGQVWTKT